MQSVRADDSQSASDASGLPDSRENVERLKTLVDPAADVWPTEVLHEVAKKRLSALLEHLSAWGDLNVTQWCTPTASIAPKGHKSKPRQIGEFQVAVHPPVSNSIIGAITLKSGLQMLRSAFTEGKTLRITSKIISINAVDDLSFQSEVIVQFFGSTDSGLLQRNATWALKWQKLDDADWRIDDIVVLNSSDVTIPESTFRDATRSVMTDPILWHPQLSLGADYWFGRIDNVGERNQMGHQGVAVGDANGDGHEDLYVAMGEGLPNKLLIKQSDGTVRDTAREAGVDWLDSTKGVLFLDLENDGDQDLLCAMASSIVVCINDGTGKFRPSRAFKAGTPAAFYSLAAADYDNDGDLDIYATRYVKARYGVSVPLPYHDANNGPRNHLMRNDGPRGFTDVTREVGLDVNNTRFSLAASWQDYDDDGDQDLYVSNDFGRNNLYRNDGGTFVDVASTAGAEDQAAGMGVSWSDFDLDGDTDVLVSNMYSSAGRRIAYQSAFLSGQDEGDRGGVQRHSLGNTLLANQGDGTFKDISESAGIRLGRWAWGAQFVDINNDGYDDMVVPNGFLTNDRMDDL